MPCRMITSATSPNTAALDMQRRGAATGTPEKLDLRREAIGLQNAAVGDEMRDDWKDAQQQVDKEQAELRREG